MGRCGLWSPERPERSATRSPPLCSTGETRCGRWSAIRSARRASSRPAVESVAGDVTDADSLVAAVEGCELVFNSMGMPEQWVRGRGDLRPGQRRRQPAARDRARSGAGSAVSSTPRLMTSSTPRRGERFDETMRRRLPEGHGVRALQAARRGAGAGRARRHGGGDPQPLRRLRPHPIADPVLRERDLRAGGAEAAPAPCPRRLRLSPTSRASPPGTCSPPIRGATASATSSPTATRASGRWPRPSARSPAVAGFRR